MCQKCFDEQEWREVAREPNVVQKKARGIVLDPGQMFNN